MPHTNKDECFGVGDRELLVRLAEKVDTAGREIREMKKDLRGNGRPGVIDRLTRVETRLMVFTGLVAALSVGGDLLPL